jgi:lysophospholipase
MNLTTQFLPCSYDGQMRYGMCAADGQAKGTVLVLPGWGEWIEKYQDVISKWNARGYNVVIPEWRGQGLSSRFLIDRNKTWLPSFDILIDDLERLFKNKLTDEKNILLLCHSMGAHIGLRWFLERGRKYPSIKGVMLTSLLHNFRTDPVPPITARILIHVATWLGFDQAYAIGQRDFDQTAGGFEKNLLTTDADTYHTMNAALNAKQEMKVGGLTYGWLYALLQSVKRLEHDLARGAPRIAYMVMGPQDDLIVQTRGFAFVASMLPNCSLHYLSGAKHELLQEAPALRAQAWTWIDEFVASIKG